MAFITGVVRGEMAIVKVNTCAGHFFFLLKNIFETVTNLEESCMYGTENFPPTNGFESKLQIWYPIIPEYCSGCVLQTRTFHGKDTFFPFDLYILYETT